MTIVTAGDHTLSGMLTAVRATGKEEQELPGLAGPGNEAGGSFWGERGGRGRGCRCGSPSPAHGQCWPTFPSAGRLSELHSIVPQAPATPSTPKQHDSPDCLSFLEERQLD